MYMTISIMLTKLYFGISDSDWADVELLSIFER